MENNAAAIESLFERAEDYGRTTAELVKLNAIDKASDIFSSLAVQFVLAIVVAMFSLMVNIGIAMWLGDYLGKSYYGFFITGGFYILAGVLLYAFRNSWIRTPVRNSIITQMIKERSK